MQQAWARSQQKQLQMSMNNMTMPPRNHKTNATDPSMLGGPTFGGPSLAMSNNPSAQNVILEAEQQQQQSLNQLKRTNSRTRQQQFQQMHASPLSMSVASMASESISSDDSPTPLDAMTPGAGYHQMDERGQRHFQRGFLNQNANSKQLRISRQNSIINAYNASNTPASNVNSMMPTPNVSAQYDNLFANSAQNSGTAARMQTNNQGTLVAGSPGTPSQDAPNLMNCFGINVQLPENHMVWPYKYVLRRRILPVEKLKTSLDGGTRTARHLKMKKELLLGDSKSNSKNNSILDFAGESNAMKKLPNLTSCQGNRCQNNLYYGFY